MDEYIQRKYRNYKKYQQMKRELEEFWSQEEMEQVVACANAV